MIEIEGTNGMETHSFDGFGTFISASNEISAAIHSKCSQQKTPALRNEILSSMNT